MDPLSTLSHAFVLVSQEECQRNIKQQSDTNNNTSESAFAIKTEQYRNDTFNAPTATPLDIPRTNATSSMDGYPLGYKLKFKNQKTEENPVNQVQAEDPRNNSKEFFSILDKE